MVVLPIHKMRSHTHWYTTYMQYSGLSEMIPSQLLSLLTWQDFEMRLCGKPEINIELLRRHTEYSGVKSSAPHIKYFWTVLKNFTHDERSRFIKFAWAQERLPASDEDFARERVRMLIKARNMRKNENPDDVFPRADTCFFNLELPPYSSEKVMEEK